MSCDQLPLVRRIAVERPKALGTAIWKAHLEACQVCRDERFALARSLAVYRQVESQERDDVAAGPSWEAFAVTLAREQRWQRVRSRMRAPLAAASVFVAVALGAMLWPAGAGNDPAGHGQDGQSAPPPLVEVRGVPAEWSIGKSLLREVGEAAAPASALTSGLPTSTVTLPAATFRRNADAVAGTPVSAVAGAARQKGTSASAAPPRLQARSKGNEEPVRTSVLLFRSLRQQQEVRRPPVSILPVSGPAVDLGTHPFAGPRPIR